MSTPTSESVDAATVLDQQEIVQRRRRHLLVVLLAVNSGATDAIGFLALGGAFTSVMTGNLVLTGVGLTSGETQTALHAALAIVSFVVGCAVGTAIAGTPQPGDGVWPGRVRWALGAQSLITAVFALSWWLSGAHPSASLGLALLAVNAVGLGIQSSAVQRFGQSGLSTTYLTGTLTTLVIRLVSGHRLRHVRRSLDLLVALVAGAAAGTALVSRLPMAAPILQLVALGLVLACAWRWFPGSTRKHRQDGTADGQISDARSG